MREEKKVEKIIEEVEKLSVLELSDLVKALEKKFGVSATPMAVPVTAGAASIPAEGGASDEPQEEQTVFNVLLANTGANKIAVIKALRELVPTLGLKEAKDIADQAPKEVITQVNKKTAEEAKAKLVTAGATVELK